MSVGMEILIGCVIGFTCAMLFTVTNALVYRLRHGPTPRHAPAPSSVPVRDCVDCGQRTTSGATCIQCRCRRQAALRKGAVANRHLAENPTKPTYPGNEAL